ncbi:ROK family transcriptional regulator [Streptomyces boninensis]|uniref:ROK family transcriptional regulator n=1 Tax=Streptomyces boninensis TaxID=2039455 RepID=UPI003B224FA6
MTDHSKAGSTSSAGTPRLLRAMNDRAALDLLIEHGPLTRTRLGHLTGLSKPTASQLLARLEAAGLVRATGTSTGGRPGPNAQLYGVNPAAAHVVGLDVTAARVHAAVADLTGRTVGTHELTVPAPKSRAATRTGTDTANAPDGNAVHLVTQAIDGAAKAAGLTRADLHRAVLGTPGAFDPATGRLRYAPHLLGWHAPTLLEELAAALPMPVEHDNDVNLAAVAEQRRGAARDHGDFVLLWNQEGIGAALVLGGRLHRGFTGGAGEVAFLPVPGHPLMRNVARANSGGFQEVAGAQAVVPLAREHGLPAPVLRGARPAYAEAAAILVANAAVRNTGPYAAFLQAFATRLATGLASITAVLDPELIVLSGSLLVAGGEPLRTLIRAELNELAAPHPHIAVGTITEHPVLTGALETALAATRDEVFDTSAL